MQLTVPQSTIEAIRSKSTRLRVIERSVKYGSLGERKRAPVTHGALLELRAEGDYETWRRNAANAPTRARAVLWLMERCEQPVASITVTVTRVERVKRNTWLIHFIPGELAIRDPTRFPAAGGPPPAICQASVGVDESGRPVKCGRAFGSEFPDEPERCRAGHLRSRSRDEDADRGYTASVGLAVTGIGQEVSAEHQRQMVKTARENLQLGKSKEREEMLSVVSKLRFFVRGKQGSDVSRKRLRSIEHHLRKMEEEARV